jgi:hypothetical protein
MCSNRASITLLNWVRLSPGPNSSNAIDTRRPISSSLSDWVSVESIYSVPSPGIGEDDNGGNRNPEDDRNGFAGIRVAEGITASLFSLSCRWSCYPHPSLGLGDGGNEDETRVSDLPIVPLRGTGAPDSIPGVPNGILVREGVMAVNR